MSFTITAAGVVAFVALTALSCRRRPEETQGDERVTDVSVTALLTATGFLMSEVADGFVGLWLGGIFVMTAGWALLAFQHAEPARAPAPRLVK